MAQLYIQKNAQPDTWVMSGAPTATTVFLSLDAQINYSDGTSDTLPANTLAVLPDATTVFDRTHDVYVCYTVQTSRVLSVIKESLLPTLTSAYAPLCRIELHSIKPYQPEPYLAGGGLGVPPVSTPIVSAAGTERVYVLGTEPATWYQVSYDDSAWAHSAAFTGSESGFYALPPGGAWVTAQNGVLGSDLHFLVRRSFALAAGTITSAQLLINIDDGLLTSPELYINGTSIGSHFVRDFSGLPVGYAAIDLDTALLTPGGSNVLALAGYSLATGQSAFSYALTVVQGPATATDATTAEGDLLYRHAGALAPLHIGPSGDVLTSNGTDPYWAAPAAGYSDPLTTKGDVLTRSASATVRLGVGSDGQVLTADSAQVDGIKWATPATSGTVTSVALAGPTGTTTSGSPITGSGTLTLSWASQSANTFLAAPDGSSGAPTFRVLASGDIPALGASKITSGQLGAARGGTGLDGSAAANGELLIGNGSGYSLATLTAGSGVAVVNSAGAIAISATGSGGSVTSVALSVPSFLSVSGSPVTTAGTLAVTLASQSQGTVFAGPSSGSAAAPTFRALAATDLPPAAAAGGHLHAHAHFL